MVMWGGGSAAAARRAGRFGLGFLAQGGGAELHDEYERAARDCGARAGHVLRAVEGHRRQRCSSPTTWTERGTSSARTSCTTSPHMRAGTKATTTPSACRSCRPRKSCAPRTAATASSTSTKPSSSCVAAAAAAPPAHRGPSPRHRLALPRNRRRGRPGGADMTPAFHLFLPQMRMSHDAIVERARAAEAVGFEGVAFMDHLAPPLAATRTCGRPWRSPGGCWHERRSLLAGHLVLCDALRHPAVLAREVTSLDHASAGRFELGIGWGSVPSELTMFGAGSTDARRARRPARRITRHPARPVDRRGRRLRRRALHPGRCAATPAADTSDPHHHRRNRQTHARARARVRRLVERSPAPARAPRRTPSRSR